MAKSTKKPKNKLGFMFGFFGLQKHFYEDSVPFVKVEQVTFVYQKHLLKDEY